MSDLGELASSMENIFNFRMGDVGNGDEGGRGEEGGGMRRTN